MTIYTNLVTNPQPITSTGWGNVNGTGGTTTPTLITAAGGPAGNNARRLTWNTDTTAFGGLQWAGSAAGAIPVSASSTISLAAYVRSSKAQRLRISCQQWDSTYTTSQGGVIQGPELEVAANTWVEMKFEAATVSATTANVRLRIENVTGTGGSFWLTNDWLEVQAATVVVAATVPQPFHGSMTDDATHDYAWTGTADASTSTLNLTSGALLAPTWIEPGVTTLTSTSSSLAWNAVAGATKYDIRRDGVVIVSDHPSTTYTDPAGGPGKVYDVRGVA